VNGAVVASWRKTSRNSFSCGVSSLISWSPLIRLYYRVRLLNFKRRPVAGILDSGSGSRDITLQRPARGHGLGSRPLSGLLHMPPHQAHASWCWPDLSSLESDQLPTQGTVQRGQPLIKQWPLALVPLDVPVCYYLVTVRTFFPWGHCQLALAGRGQPLIVADTLKFPNPHQQIPRETGTSP
jgi:hypothetical protein